MKTIQATGYQFTFTHKLPEAPQSPHISGCVRDLIRDILLNSLSLFAKHIHFVFTHNISNASKRFKQTISELKCTIRDEKLFRDK